MSGLVSSVYNSDAKPAGRRDKEGQEKSITLDPLREKLDHLLDLYASSRTSAEIYSDAVKAIADETGLMATVVRSFVAAKAKPDGFKDAKRKADQLSLVFGEAIKPDKKSNGKH